MKQIINIAAGAFLGISMTFLIVAVTQLKDKPISLDGFNKTYPVTKKMDSKNLDFLIHAELLISGVSMALFAGLAVAGKDKDKVKE
jgi:hypothetical protein